MAKESQLKLRFSTGSAIMLSSLPFPFIILRIREFVRDGYLAFELGAMVLVVGYLLYCWEDIRAKRRFNVEMISIVIIVLILFAILGPGLSSSR